MRYLLLSPHCRVNMRKERGEETRKIWHGRSRRKSKKRWSLKEQIWEWCILTFCRWVLTTRDKHTFSRACINEYNHFRIYLFIVKVEIIKFGSRVNWKLRTLGTEFQPPKREEEVNMQLPNFFASKLVSIMQPKPKSRV